MQSLPVICRVCGAGVAMRVSRAGFFQKRVLSLLGIYPWKCGACGSAFLYPRRRNRDSKESQPQAAGERRPVEPLESHQT